MIYIIFSFSFRKNVLFCINSMMQRGKKWLKLSLWKPENKLLSRLVKNLRISSEQPKWQKKLFHAMLNFLTNLNIAAANLPSVAHSCYCLTPTYISDNRATCHYISILLVANFYGSSHK